MLRGEIRSCIKAFKLLVLNSEIAKLKNIQRTTSEDAPLLYLYIGRAVHPAPYLYSMAWGGFFFLFFWIACLAIRRI